MFIVTPYKPNLQVPLQRRVILLSSHLVTSKHIIGFGFVVAY